MKNCKYVVFVLVAFLLSVTKGYADLINFETGFSNGDSVSSISTTNNILAVTVTGGGPSWIADIGNPVTAFVPLDGLGYPAADVAGTYFLTDEPSGPSVASDYYFNFLNPIDLLSFDLYDYRATDGGSIIGDAATLTIYEDALMTTILGSTSFTISGSLPDGNVIDMDISSTNPFLSASLTFSGRGDIGTGIDNISFNTVSVPEPSTLLLLGTGLLGIGVFRRKYKE